MFTLLDKVKNSPHCIAITSACIIITAAIFFYVFYATIPVNWWRELCEKLIFPAIAAISGGLAVVWAGESAINRWMGNYTQRTGYGLTERKILFKGNAQQISSIREDLHISGLIHPHNYNSDTIPFHQADLIILCLKEEEGIDAHTEIRKLYATLEANQALVVFTDYWFDNETKALVDNRPFSVINNCRGKVINDIHSLLTTLPPRNLN